MPHIFISYAKKDTRDLAIKLSETLGAIPGVTVWMDRGLEAGESWALQIQEEIDRADYVVVLLSPDVNRKSTPTQARSFVLNEIDYAQQDGKQIIPVMAMQTKVPVQIAGIQYIDFSANTETGIQKLVSDITRRTGIIIPTAVVAPPIPNDKSDTNKIESRKTNRTDWLTAIAVLIIVTGIVLIIVSNQNGVGENMFTPEPTTEVAAIPMPQVPQETHAIPTMTMNSTLSGENSVNLPTIDPNDLTCRALVNTDLNMRQGPTSDYPSIQRLAAGEIIPIIGRLGDNSWWQVRTLSLNGWIFAQSTSAYGNCFGVPIVTDLTVTPTYASNAADLFVSDLSGPINPTLPDGADSITRTYSFTISNKGQTQSGQTATILRILPSSSQAFILTPNLNPGESVTLEGNLTFTNIGTFQIEVFADSQNKLTEEISEFDNKALLTVTVKAG